jgi:hypothetical protein
MKTIISDNEILIINFKRNLEKYKIKLKNYLFTKGVMGGAEGRGGQLPL